MARINRSTALMAHAFVGAAAVLLGACSGGATPMPETLPAGAPPDFYDVSRSGFEGTPGQVVASLEIQAAVGTRAWIIIYGSSGVDGALVPVSGLVLAPVGPPPKDGYPIVAYAHGTAGLADQCAPSRSGALGVGTPILSLVKLGYVVAMTDYQGLGTAGIHPYIVGVAEGRSVLDSLRAVRNLPDAHASKESVIIGQSEGGYAALWAGQLAPTYLGDFNVHGVLAASAPIDLIAIEKAAFKASREGELSAVTGPLRVFGVWSEIYGLSLDFLTEEGRQTAQALMGTCDDHVPHANPYLADPAARSDWHGRMVDNTPGSVRSGAPIVVVAPTEDEVVPYDTQVSGAAILCRARDTVELRTVHGDHGSSMFTPYAWEMTQGWIHDRFTGRPALNTCS